MIPLSNFNARLLQCSYQKLFAMSLHVLGIGYPTASYASSLLGLALGDDIVHLHLLPQSSTHGKEQGQHVLVRLSPCCLFPLD